MWNRICEEQGFDVIGWREGPCRQFEALSDIVRETEPAHWQIFLAKPKDAAKDQDAFERRLYLVRKIVSNADLQRL